MDIFAEKNRKWLLLGGGVIAVVILFGFGRGGGGGSGGTGALAAAQAQIAQTNAQAQVALGAQQKQANIVAAQLETQRAGFAAALAGKQLDTNLQAGIASASALNTRAAIQATLQNDLAQAAAGSAAAHTYADTATAISLNQMNTAKALAPIYVKAQQANNALASETQLQAAQMAAGPANTNALANLLVGGAGAAARLAPTIASLFGGSGAAAGAVPAIASAADLGTFSSLGAADQLAAGGFDPATGADLATSLFG
jgi:hypothetical protein